MNKIYFLLAACLFNYSVYASSNWFLTVYNNSDHVYEIGESYHIFTRCWNLEDLKKHQFLLPHSVGTFKMSESYRFPFCFNGEHDIQLYGYFWDVSPNTPVHTLILENGTKAIELGRLHVTYPTYKKGVFLRNHNFDEQGRDETEMSSKGYDEELICDSIFKNGDTYLSMKVLKNGKALMDSKQCAKYVYVN